ncbi:alpha-glucosidase [Sediminispirochaeta smaragdinae]|uniref:Alpha amylase catalytic region n=1 Tax=Sediminispirochaeta smaragdinae (strain DSM 11293 / JCM 15392 / SEBR 4228) TaxID=573413 RepID=E1R8U1_SEDSS|nr:alpha-glucosidase [Sediminispirochaeta smaragdinae]ADK81848.1 alpha amylase catalytic region [Sediminispirochaeta smaragdinae DSM 11293]
MKSGAEHERRWWKEGVVYQIYPRSFADSNGDGIGDVRGIINHLDYLKWLGIDIVWLNPIYRSPNDDNGYDISDYRSIMEDFGTMSDFDELLTGLHDRGIRLIMDLVVNHTSDEHQWFIESRKSRDNPYRNYYIWRPPAADGGVPNDWQSFFEGPAWDFDEATGEYYLHLFSKKQPDLNWENERVREEVYDLMGFWLDKGIDGFRMDVINLISKRPGLPNSRKGSTSRIVGGEHFINGPRLEAYLSQLRGKVLDGRDIMTVGETPDVTPEIGLRYVGKEQGALNMLFSFEHMDIDFGKGGSWDIDSWTPAELFSIFARWQMALNGKGWNSLFLNNHDQPRQVSRFGDDGVYRNRSAKLLALFLHTLQGTPYVYQGEEIGMANVPFTSIDECRDISSRNYWKRAVQEGQNKEEVFRRILYRGRDNARTPMQWNDSPHAGFSSVEPWIACNPDYHRINVSMQKTQEDSILWFYRRLIALRKVHPVFAYGSFEEIAGSSGGLIAYRREDGPSQETLLVVLNWSGDQAVQSPAVNRAIKETEGDRILLTSCEDDPNRLTALAAGEPFLPWEAVAILCDG